MARRREFRQRVEVERWLPERQPQRRADRAREAAARVRERPREVERLPTPDQPRDRARRTGQARQEVVDRRAGAAPGRETLRSQREANATTAGARDEHVRGLDRRAVGAAPFIAAGLDASHSHLGRWVEEIEGAVTLDRAAASVDAEVVLGLPGPDGQGA